MSFTSPIQKLAKEFAAADIATQATSLINQQAKLDAESSGLDNLGNAITDFQSAIDALNSDTDGPLTYSATSNNESNTVSANSLAQEGTYSFYVTKLAQAQQSTFSMNDSGVEATGVFELSMNGGVPMDINLADADKNYGDGNGTVDASELVKAINDSDDNPGVSAALVKANGTTTIMLTSETTGEQSKFTFSITGNDALSSSMASSEQTMTIAQDAEIHLGSQGGPIITNSTNTFDNVIPGVTMTFSDASDPNNPDDLTKFTIAEDTSGSQAKVQTFVDAYNTLVDTINSLTSYGDQNKAAGVFAGDAGLKSLLNQVNEIAHDSYNGISIMDYGITLDTDGHLQLDPTQFSKGIEENPTGLTSIFVGDNSVVVQMDDLMEGYVDSNSGIISMRQENIDNQQDKLSNEGNQLTQTYNTNYERYVKEYTNTLVEVASMKRSMAAFM